MTAYTADFEDQVRHLLSNLYDYLRLAENPLAQRLAADARGKERINVIRAALLRAIDELRPGHSPNPSPRQSRLHSILRLRYVEERTTGQVLDQLALSERQYYREHQRAIQNVSRIIWDQHFASAAAPAAAEISLAGELDYLDAEGRNQPFHTRDELLAAIMATRALAEASGITLAVDSASPATSLKLSQPVFRQCVIYLLNALIDLTAPGGRITLELRHDGGIPAIALQVQPALADGHAACARISAQATPRQLLSSLNADLRWDAASAAFALTFTEARHNILIVDDNPDTIALFKRYLSDQPYQLLTAAGAAEASEVAAANDLLCVILDIMLPGEDGWQILQSFKSQPATAVIPVLICSVLEMEALARSLGADGYLKKPPPRDEFLATLRHWQTATLD